jgi:hypothetical protein
MIGLQQEQLYSSIYIGKESIGQVVGTKPVRIWWNKY